MAAAITTLRTHLLLAAVDGRMHDVIDFVRCLFNA